MPSWPLELERLVFETAARSQPSQIKRLMLIARRVRDWVELLRFEALHIRDETSLDRIVMILNAKPPGFVARAVKTILFTYNTFDSGFNVGLLLSMCTGLVRLKTELIPEGVLFPMRLQQLSIADAPHLTALPETITYLEIFWASIGNRRYPYEIFPNLTHLALAVEFRGWDAGSTNLITDMVDHILNTCRCLQMPVLLFERDSRQACVEGLQHIVSPRLFFGCLQGHDEDWEDCLFGDDVWTKASRSIPFRVVQLQ
jgi:hypothetical protein